MTTNPILDITLDLREILNLAKQLPARSVETNAAVIALAPVANQEAWQHRQQSLEEYLEASWWRRGWCDYPPPQTITSSTPLQLLCVWTERIRAAYGLERDQTPLGRTFETEVGFIRWQLDTIANDLTQPQLAAFARDIHTCRIRLEDVTLDGLRDETSRDVTCLADGCGAFLVRRMLDEGHGKKARRGLSDEWSCPRCDRRYTPAQYNVALAEAARQSAIRLVTEATRRAPDTADTGVAS